MDGIFLLNKTRIMQTCMADGTVLKPDAPVHTSDWCFLASSKTTADHTAYLYHTFSDLSGFGRIHYHFNNNDANTGKGVVTPAMVHLDDTDVGKYAVTNWYTGETALLNTSTPITEGYEGHTYATVSPIVQGWVFIGETNKYVVAAGKRFSAVAASVSELSVVVHGVEGEDVKVCAVRSASLGNTMCNTVSFTSTGPLKTTFK